MARSVTRGLARLPREASLSLPPIPPSRTSFSPFLSRGRDDLEVVRDGEGWRWRWSRLSHLPINSQIAGRVSPPSLPSYLSNISAMVSPLNSRGLTQKF